MYIIYFSLMRLQLFGLFLKKKENNNTIMLSRRCISQLKRKIQITYISERKGLTRYIRRY